MAVTLNTSGISFGPTPMNIGGSAPSRLVRSWVTFDARTTGTPSIIQSSNVSSMTDLGVGVYRINHTYGLGVSNSPVTVTGAFDTTDVDANTPQCGLYRTTNALSDTSVTVAFCARASTVTAWDPIEGVVMRVF